MFKKFGYKVSINGQADIYVINTCCVTNVASSKSKQTIRKCRRNNPNALVAAVGCLCETSEPELKDLVELDLFLGNSNKYEIVSKISQHARIKPTNISKNSTNSNVDMQFSTFENYNIISSIQNRTRAILKVEDGCQSACTYCIIPKARGPIRSRVPNEIIKEVNSLQKSGFKEIVITGIHLSSYGKDIKGENLIELIEMIHDKTKIERIRLSSLEPTTFTFDFLSRLKKLPRVCPSFHVSLQSGSDRILQLMKRKYNRQHYLNIINMIKNQINNATICTDIMVGFPSETDEDFDHTVDLAEKANFLKIHVFKYSKRNGTIAANMPNQIPNLIKYQRSSKLIALSTNLYNQNYKKYIGNVLEVLIEKQVSSNVFEGFTENYLRTCIIARGEMINNIVKIRPFCYDGKHLVAEVD